jgi:hypothetical protein
MKTAYITIKVNFKEELTEDEAREVSQEMDYSLNHKWISSTEVIEISED